MLEKIRAYPKLEAKDVRRIRKHIEDGIESQLLVMQTSFGYRRMMELLRPEAGEACAAILYVHWYEPEFV